jgi:hypothetical protein
MPTRYGYLALFIVFLIGGCQQQVSMDAHVLTPRARGQEREGRLVITKPQFAGDRFRKHWIDIEIIQPKPFETITENDERAASIRAAVNDLTTPAFRLAYDKLLREGVSAMPFIIERWEIHERGIESPDAAKTATPSEAHLRHHVLWGDIEHFSAHSSSAIHCADLHDTGITMNFFLTDMVMYHSNFSNSETMLPSTSAEWKQWLAKNGRGLLIYYPGQHRVRMPFKIYSGENEGESPADGAAAKPATKKDA